MFNQNLYCNSTEGDLELRAKKFGAAPTGEVAKLAWAVQFGTNTTTDSSTSDTSITATKTAPDVELLKKRAERFGGSVSNTMVSMEQKEKLQKRQERFPNEFPLLAGNSFRTC